jgi:FlgD Ig-like domain
MSIAFRILMILSILTLIFGSTHVAAEWSHDPMVNNVICAAQWQQTEQQIISDGSGGAIIAWEDTRSGDGVPVIYAQRVDRDGNPQWLSDGMQVCTYESEQADFRLVTDNDGGCFVVWVDTDGSAVNIYAQRLGHDGSYLWSSEGQAVTTAYSDQSNICAASDEAHALYVGWADLRSANLDIYAQKLDGNGNRMWSSVDMPVCTATGSQTAPEIALDGTGGAFIVWEDTRDGSLIYMQKLDSDGAPAWPLDGRLTSGNLGVCSRPIIDIDGDGNLYAAWRREESSIQHFSLGLFSPITGFSYWLGLPAGLDNPSSDYQILASLDSGVYVCWAAGEVNAEKIHVQKYTSDVGSLWGDDGMQVTPDIDPDTRQRHPVLSHDGYGGLTVCWTDGRTGDPDIESIYGQRFSQYGQRIWPDEGAIITIPAIYYSFPAIITTSENDFIIAWYLVSNGSYDVHAQLLDKTGHLGRPAPEITSVGDFPNDQGGAVILDWNASYLDDWDWQGIESYTIWARDSEAMPRRQDVDTGTKRLTILSSMNPPPRPGKDEAVDPYQTMTDRLQLTEARIEQLYRTGWIYVLEIPAMLQPDYSSVAFTFGDSTMAGIPWAEYKVVAHGDEPMEYWESSIGTGFSVDNYAPGAPLALSGEVVNETEVNLTWMASGHHDEDLYAYQIYRGDVADFPLDPAHLIGTSGEPTYLDPSGEGLWYYRVTGIDCHGNEGDGSNETEVVVGSSAVDEQEMPIRSMFHAIYPNPSLRRATLSFDLAEAAEVQLVIWSVDGRMVSSLANGIYPGGHYVINWHGDDDQGHALPQGVYFARFTANAYSKQQRLMLIR